MCTMLLGNQRTHRECTLDTHVVLHAKLLGTMHVPSTGAANPLYDIRTGSSTLQPLWRSVGKYVDAESDPEEVVTDLEGLLQHISGLGEALGLYNQYLTLFDAAPDELSTLALAEKEANNRYQVTDCSRHTHAPYVCPQYTCAVQMALRDAGVSTPVLKVVHTHHEILSRSFNVSVATCITVTRKHNSMLGLAAPARYASDPP